MPEEKPTQAGAGHAVMNGMGGNAVGGLEEAFG